jgi:hypothetical protein
MVAFAFHKDGFLDAQRSIKPAADLELAIRLLARPAEEKGAEEPPEKQIDGNVRAQMPEPPAPEAHAQAPAEVAVVRPPEPRAVNAAKADLPKPEKPAGRHRRQREKSSERNDRHQNNLLLEPSF